MSVGRDVANYHGKDKPHIQFRGRIKRNDILRRLEINLLIIQIPRLIIELT